MKSEIEETFATGDKVTFKGDDQEVVLRVNYVNHTVPTSYDVEQVNEDGDDELYMSYEYVPGRLLKKVVPPYEIGPGDVLRDQDGDFWFILKDGRTVMADGISLYDLQTPVLVDEAVKLHKAQAWNVTKNAPIV